MFAFQLNADGRAVGMIGASFAAGLTFLGLGALITSARVSTHALSLSAYALENIKLLKVVHIRDTRVSTILVLFSVPPPTFWKFSYGYALK